MQRALWALTGVMLAACQPTVPNSAAGVGFGDYSSYLKAREAELRGQAAPSTSTPPISAAPSAMAPPGGGYGVSGYGATPVTSPAGLAAQGQTAPPIAPPTGGTIGADALAALQATAPASTAPAIGAATGPANDPANGPANGPALGAPLDAMTPAAIPAVSGAAAGGSTGPNLAAYALAATNAPGQAVYPRGGIKLVSSARACAKFVSPDLAQMAFLERGGPQKDPRNLDPDGDGFACGWDPRPFQTARP